MPKGNWTLFRLVGSYSVRLYAPPATSRPTQPIASAAASDRARPTAKAHGWSSCHRDARGRFWRQRALYAAATARVPMGDAMTTPERLAREGASGRPHRDTGCERASDPFSTV
jgi:hypothetical protein